MKKYAINQEPTKQQPNIQPASGYQWSWDINIQDWIQVPINSKNTYNITTNDNQTTNQQTTNYTQASLQCLNKLLSEEQYINEFKIEAELIRDGLVEYAGYDFKKGTKVRISPKGLQLLKENEEKEIKSLQDDINNIPTTINGLSYPIKGISPYEPVYDNDNRRFANKDK